VAGLESVPGEHGYLPAGRLPGLVVQASMLASEDAAESGLVRGRPQAGEAGCDTDDDGQRGGARRGKGSGALTHRCPLCAA